MNFFVSGLVNIETTAAVRGFPISYYPIDYPFFGVGSTVSGVGYNITNALTVLGDSVSLHTLIGRDEEADRIFARMKKDGIDSSGVLQELDSTPASVVLYDPDGRRQIYCDLKNIQNQTADPIESEKRLRDCDC